MPVIAKLETQQAIVHLDEIVERAGGVMVARGDLGLDLPPEHVPLAQKRIIRTANLAGRPVITATQMLESMTRRPRPTRAEATDVANAVLDGTDAVMLSGETAAGSYPLESVEMMARIIRATEGGRLFASQVAQPDTARINPHASDADAISVAAVSLARQTGASALVVYTLSGTTALLVSRQRPAMPIFALTPSEEVRRRLAVVWGVTAFVVPETDSVDRLLAVGEEVLLTQRALKKGQCVVRVAGTTDTAGGTNVVQLSRVGQVARQRTWAG
jgi:pyruvate kinase